MANAKIVIDVDVLGQKAILAASNQLKNVGTNARVADARLKKLQASAANASRAFSTLGTALKVGVAAGIGAATIGLGKFVSDTFSAGTQVEQLQNRFQLLFGSVEEGGKAFDSLAAFAAKVPFSLEEIAAGSGNLAVISEDAKDLSKIMEITGNVAAATGLDFQQTATQIQRSFAGGIASADVFRERGVRAMLGFEAGVKVSVEETKKRFFEVFGPGGEFGNATKLLANTLTGQVSMVQDKYFQFRSIVAKSFFEPLKKQIKDLNKELSGNQKQLEKLAKEIGGKLAVAFKNIESGIRFLITNFDKLVLATKVFIGLKLGGIVAGIAAQFILASKNILRFSSLLLLSNKRLKVFNILVRANPLGMLLTAIQLAVVGLVAFRDELKAIGSYIKSKLDPLLIKLRGDFKAFDDADLDFFDEDKAVEAIRKQQKGVEDSIRSYKRLTQAQKEAFSGGFETRADKFRKFERSGPQDDMASEAKAAQEAIAKKNMAINERIFSMNRSMERDQAKARVAAQEATTRAVEEYRKKLAFIGIESKAIAGIISDSWLTGIREGNSLLEITKTAFKNVFVSISDMLVKRSAELLIERLFIQFADQKIIKQRQLNAEVNKQGTLMDTIISKGSSLFSSMGGSKIGGLFSSLFGGGGGSNLMGLGSKKGFFGMNKGGVVPGGAPYTDRIPTMLTPGEVVIPRNKTDNAMGSTSITNINISGNVDQRSIDQIKAVISQSSAEVGGANRTFQRNSQGVRGRSR
jgi:hypothetical protein